MSVHPSIRPISILLRTSMSSGRDEEICIFGGSGAPSGGALPNGDTLASGQCAAYFREDAASLDTLLYWTTNGGTAWSAASLSAGSTIITDAAAPANWYTTDTMQGVADGAKAAIGGTSQGVRNYSSNIAVTDNDDLVVAIGKLDAALAVAREQVLPMGVYGTWAIDGDGARTNGAGLVGATPVLTEQAAALAKVENNTVFGNLSAVNAGYGATYQIFPDAPVAGEDYAYFGGAVPFPELAFDMSATVATFDAADVLEWEYWDGSAWSALTIAHDGTSASTADGTLAFGRDGAISFVPPADWASTTVDSQAGYWIRVGIQAGKAANLTAIPITNSKEHELVTPGDGYLVRQGGTITSIRLNDGASTLHTANDIKFVLVNFTTGAHSGELTFAQDQRTDAYTGLSLAVADADELGVIVTAEDGTNEASNVLLELGITLS